MTPSQFRNLHEASEDLLEKFVQLSATQQQDLKPCILELAGRNHTAFQKQQLALCGLMAFSLKDYLSIFKTLPEYYFTEKQYQKYRPKWFQDYIDGYLKNLTAIQFETIADLINSYNYVFKDKLILKKLIHLDELYEINPKDTFESKIVSLLSNYPKFVKQHIYLLFTEEAENYFEDAQSRSRYKAYYIDIDSWVKIIYKLYETIELDRVKLLTTCMFTPLKNLKVNTRHWFYKLFAKLKPTKEELKQIEEELVLRYQAKNLEIIQTAFLQPEIDAKTFKEVFLPELRYVIDENLEAKKVIHNNKLPVFKGFTTNEVKCEILQAITSLNKHSKKAYIPLTETVKEEHSIHSKFGGLPYLTPENEYPKCSNCGKHLQLLVQLNLEDLPENTENGLIQLYFCTNPNTQCESKLTSKNITTSIFRKLEITGNSVIDSPDKEPIFPEKRITQFIEFIDYPHREDYYKMGIELQVPDAIYDYMMANNIGTTNANDKLFGYPHWLQSSEFTNTLKSDNEHLLFQLASNDNLPFMFGDSGIGYLLKNRNHNNPLSFYWQCF